MLKKEEKQVEDKLEEQEENTQEGKAEEKQYENFQDQVVANEEAIIIEDNELADAITDLKAKIKDKDEHILRLSAEIQNMNRRQQKDRQDREKYRSQALANALLDSMDNLERALLIEADGEAAKNLKKGIEMVQLSIINAFKSEGIEVIDPLGDIFDPTLHQSVSFRDKADSEKDEEVVEVLQKGYRLKDRIIRPAMVIIAK